MIPLHHYLNTVLHIDCLKGLKELPTSSIDSCVTDPPYGIRFMNKKWDYEIPSIEIWKQILRVLKPGAHMLVACGTKTQHRMAVNIEEAGFEIRDVITWHYGQGFPKSLDIGKAMDKAAGAKRKKVPNPKAKQQTSAFDTSAYGNYAGAAEVAPHPVTDAAKKWNGWGTALKPATEFWTLARKPLAEKTIAQNILKHGTGGLNIDACRIEGHAYTQEQWHQKGLSRPSKNAYGKHQPSKTPLPTGRFPANLILDEFMAGEMDQQTGNLTSGKPSGIRKAKNNVYGQYAPGQEITGYGDSGGGSRFFYVAKASAKERGTGNNHPTVKPISLMKYLIRLVCPLEPGRIVLDPFAGSGSTCIAAQELELTFIAFERQLEYVKIARNRVNHFKRNHERPSRTNPTEPKRA